MELEHTQSNTSTSSYKKSCRVHFKSQASIIENIPFETFSVGESEDEDDRVSIAESESSTNDIINWNMPFAQSSQSQASSNRQRRPSYSVKARTRLNSITRGPSHALSHAVDRLDPLKKTGNTLGLEINEVRQLNSTACNSSKTFRGRRPTIYAFGEPDSPTEVASVTEKFSLFPTVPTQPQSQPQLEPTPAYVPAIAPDPGFQTHKSTIKGSEEQYLIQRLAAQDDIECLSSWKRLIYRLSPILIISSTVAYCAYFVLRIKYMRGAELSRNTIFWAAWVFLIVEFYMAAPLILHRIWSWYAVTSRRRPKLRLIGDNVPCVDVIITCCGEDLDVILDTVRAACHLDYPPDQFRIVVCDDTRSDALSKAIDLLVSKGMDNLYYKTRIKTSGIPDHSKAGNLNFAFGETKRMPGGAASFIATLDADMIPEPHWLRALLPHMLQDGRCWMACPPKLSYNIPVDDPLTQSPDTFIHISEPMKESLGIAWCVGSGYILRREGLEELCGFPIGTLADDVRRSTMLLTSGWNTAFVDEPLQWGIVPNHLKGHLERQSRWTIDTIQTSITLRFSLFGKLVKHMTFTQRIFGFFYTFSPFFIVFLAFAMLGCPAILMTSQKLIPYSTTQELYWLLTICFIYTAFNKWNDLVTYFLSGRRTGWRDMQDMIWMAPHHTISIIHTFCCSKMCPKSEEDFLDKRKSTSTIDSITEKAQARFHDTQRRLSLCRRLKISLWDCRAIFHLLYIGFVLASVGLSCYWKVTKPENDTLRKKLEGVLTHAAWPPLIWFACLTSSWIPIQYALFPPKTLDRQVLLERDPITKVAHPTAEAKKVKLSWGTYVQESLQCLIFGYGAFLFVLTFII